MATLRRALLVGACCSGGGAFAPSSSMSRRHAKGILHTFPPDNNDGAPGPYTRSGPNRRGRIDDPFSPQSSNRPPPRGPRRPFGYNDPDTSVDLDGRISSNESNLSRRTPSVNEDPRPFDMDRRFSQRPRSGMLGGQRGGEEGQRQTAWWDSTPSDRIQGGSRSTYAAPANRDASHVFLESDGRPLDVEFELYDGPNNTPTKMRYYSEDGRMRPINAMVENPQKGQRGNTLSVRNTGPMEFPITAGVASVRDSPDDRAAGGLAGSESSYLASRDLDGFATQPTTPSSKRGETVQGDGALRTWPLDHSVEAVKVTITTDGYPMNAKLELWGTSSHVKQLAEIYNDNGKTRPFSAIIDVPGGSNTVAVTNTGPMEYPIRVAVEPVARTEGWDGTEEKFGGSLAPW